MKIALFILCIFATFSTALAQEEWVLVASTDDMVWEVKPGSFENSKTKGGVPIAVVVGRVANNKTKHIDLYKWYVTIGDCNRQMGKFVTLGLDGAYQFENDFVIGAGNVASSVANAICSVQKMQVEERRSKGI